MLCLGAPQVPGKFPGTVPPHPHPPPKHVISPPPPPPPPPPPHTTNMPLSAIYG